MACLRDERYQRIRNVLIGILVLNWIVAGAKIAYGIMIRSVSILADGFHSLGDGASNIIGLVGIMVAAQPVDAEHPYGHSKYETMATVCISALLFFIAFSIAKTAVAQIVRPVSPDVTGFSFIVMVGTLLINTGVTIYERRVGKTLQSDLLVSDAMHTRSDVLVTMTVIAGLIGTRLGVIRADGVIGVLVSGYIAFVAVRLLMTASDVLCDRGVIDPLRIRQIVMEMEGVQECHQIRTRGRPDDAHIDLHVLVSETMIVDKAHALSHVIIERLKERIPGVTDVVVHVEPEHDKWDHMAKDRRG